ncbi:MAG: FAD:protein FMN transferase [Mariniphaga sp.]
MRFRILVVLILLTGFQRCSPPAAYFYNEGFIYGTLYHIVYENPKGKDLHDEIKEELNRYNKIFSTYDSTSVISKINNNQPVELPDLFVECFQRSMEISEITGGAFDITAGPMVNAWGFGPEDKMKMTPEKIDSLKKITGYRKVRLHEGEIIKENPHMKLDMSAVAKGFTSDFIARFLAEKGCENYMVEIGGEVMAKGVNEKGRIWSIGISKPEESAFFASSDIHAVVKLPEHALATSGNYRNFYIEDGIRYAHTIDPKTGYPVQHSLLSATVLADNCMDADAFATAFMVLGLEKSIEIAGNYPAIKVYFIYSGGGEENQVYMSESFKEHLPEPE